MGDPFWMSDGYRAMDQREAIKVMQLVAPQVKIAKGV